ncbi:MAG: hypothetical protein ACYS76_03400 [Planctomycetota bacterium]|jgi:hypothetical protein
MKVTRIAKLVVLVTVAGCLVTPAWGHPKYWPNASGLLVPYTHSHREAAPPTAHAGPSDLVGGASAIVGGTFQYVGGAISGTLGGGRGEAPRHRRYIDFSNASGLIVRVPAD